MNERPKQRNCRKGLESPEAPGLPKLAKLPELPKLAESAGLGGLPEQAEAPVSGNCPGSGFAPDSPESFVPDHRDRLDSGSGGSLFVVATPLGNPADLSPRAREVLGRVDCVLAEDTRRSGLLLAACGVKAKGFMSLHDHNEEGKIPALLEELAAGRSFALVSDAGTPLFSDPGYKLVRACRKQGIKVSPLPGPSAPLAALCASGLPPQPFVFLGFPPRKSGDIRKFFAPYAALEATLCFFERKDRLKSTLALLLELCGGHEQGGERELCIARELTKTYEEFILLPLAQYSALPDDLLGEITVLLGPPLGKSRLPEAALAELLAEALAGGAQIKPRQLARELQSRAAGWSVGEVYDFILAQRHETREQGNGN